MEYYLKGDLGQMGAQRSLLVNYGFSLEQSNVYPVVTSDEDYDKAVRLFYTFQVDGWWHYKDKIIELGEATKYEVWSKIGSPYVRLYHFENRRNVWDGEITLNGVLTTDPEVVVHKGDIIINSDLEYTIR